MAVFDVAVEAVLKHEGGFVSNAADRGGPTNMGITLPDLEAFVGKPVTLDDLKNLSRGDAVRFYQQLWKKSNMDLIPHYGLATVLFDQIVLFGTHVAVSRFQNALGGVAITGSIGPQTAQETAKLSDSARVATKMLRESTASMIQNVKKRPSQFQFLGGWLDRLWDLQENLTNY